MINVEHSDYILRVIAFDALNRQGDYITHFSFKDYNLHTISDEFSKPEGAEGEFYWVNEHTCPTNIIDINVELFDGSCDDPHGLLTLIGYLPEKIISKHTQQIHKDIDFNSGMNTNFFNFLLRLYKSLYHMMRSCYIYDPMEYNHFGQPYYFSPFTNEQNSRINYIVCELLSNDSGILKLINQPKGEIIDINQYCNKGNGNYNGLIYGLPQYLFDKIGYDRLMEILDTKFLFDEDKIVDLYYSAKHIKKVID